ncbi:unnamed protein product [Hydatigera taeniaeformis]|uniref:WD_REPEATS_REGION domain-containing protein n=1 Tax=Hydatigena taeniaeformis TaxID=6205 RepID=A0A0R3WL71_HYDTA|nr:unnamed protein product [Hydatigera taeniaeformis]
MKNVVEFLKESEVQGFQSHTIANFSDKIPFHDANLLKPDLPASSRSVLLLKVNCNNTVIAAAHMEGTVILYNSSNAECIGQCEGHEKPPWTINFHPSIPHLLVSGCLGGRVCLWSIADIFSTFSGCQRIVKPIFIHNQLGAIASLTFHPYLSILAVAWTQEIAFIDYNSGNVLSVWRFACDSSSVRWLNFNLDGLILYTGSTNPHPPESNSLSLLSVQDSMTSSPLDISPSRILRGELVHFLLGQSAEWYEDLGICQLCSLRLCIWAAGLAVDCNFPHHEPPSSEAVDHLLKEVSLNVPNGSSKAEEVIALHHKDPSPSVVVVIEDFPSNEWLRFEDLWSFRCSTPQPLMMCCPGHIYDLFLTHRDLMRYSLCRLCLQKFWLWANDRNRVEWFTWIHSDPSPNKSSSSSPQKTQSKTALSARVCYQCYQESSLDSKHADTDSVEEESSLLSLSNLLDSRLLTSIIQASVSNAQLNLDPTVISETGGCKRKHPDHHNYGNNNSMFSGAEDYADPDHSSKTSSSNFTNSSESDQLWENNTRRCRLFIALILLVI